MKSVMNAHTGQQEHWDNIFAESKCYFGDQPSSFAQNALDLFQANGISTILETGCGQGRDTYFFARNSLHVTALDYSQTAILDIHNSIEESELSQFITPHCCDIRKQLPFEDNSFDAFYSHMLMCMELTTAEIACALSEIHRILKPGGLAIYSVRSIFDRHYRAGEHLGEDMFEVGDIAVHFFSKEKITGMASGFKILDVERMEEGALPRDLFCVAMKKTSTRYAATFPPVSSEDNQEKLPLARNRSKPQPFCPGAT